MKTLNRKHVKIIFSLSLLVLLSSACTQGSESKHTSTTQEGSSSNTAEAPEMDIHTAVLYGNLEAVQQHIEAGSDLNVIEPMGGSTPLSSAATFNKQDIAKALIDAGADLTIKNNDGSTALHAAAFFCRVEIVQMLLDAKADKTVKNSYGATAMESISGPFEEIKPVYEMLQQQLSPFGLNLDMEAIEKTRPVIAIMLQ